MLDVLGYEKEREEQLAKQNKQPSRINNYDLKQLIGEGNFTEIYEAVDKTSQKHYAIKIASK